MRRIKLNNPPYKLSLGCGKKDEAEFLKDEFAPPNLRSYIGQDERDLDQYGHKSWKLIKRNKYPTERGLDLQFILEK